MCVSPFQKWHKQRKAHDDHNVKVTLPSLWALLLYACAERTSPFYPFPFFVFVWQPEMPPDAGHDGRESAPATIPGCYIFPVLKPSCPAFARRGNGRQDHLETSAAGRTPATASHACMTMTVAGLPSRRQESDAFPLDPLRRPFHFSPFPFRLSSIYADVPMPPFQTASVVIFVAGAKVKTGLGTQIF